MSSAKKLKGIYLRGNIFWFRHGTGPGRRPLSLATSDAAEAIHKARTILENPALNPGNGFLTALNRYAVGNLADNTWNRNRRTSKPAILKLI